ncbi:MAG: acetylglutamate kinase [Deltaproteobacteria bacterium]|nr:MAG: acetylglutamate kinase [Deltaproteobacteria bacterium]
MEDREVLERLIDDITLMHLVGIRVVVVHGGGRHVTDLARQLGLESRFVGGRRVTDEPTLDVLKMVLSGKISVEILSLLKKKGVRAMGVSGVAAGVIEARRRPPTRVSGGGDELVDFGEVGDIERIDTRLLQLLLDEGYIPVLSPLGADADGDVLNINADTVAAHLAASLNAEKLLLLTGTPGVMTDLKDPTSLISRITADEAREAIEKGIIQGGMIPKIEESLYALGRGAGQVHILSALEPHQMLLEIFTRSGCGTMLVP